MKHFVPRELTPYTLEVHRHRHMKRSQAIYVLLIFFIISALIALPLVKVDVFTSAPGMIQTELDPLRVSANASGLIKQFSVEENSYVHLGDTLLVIERMGLVISDKKNILIQLAPVSGYVHILDGFKQGERVREGDPILEITPESGLIVKCHVSSEDIGFVEPNQEVEYQIRSLKRRGLGLAKGRVISIAPVVNSEGGSPAFEVRCSLDTLQGASDTNNSASTSQSNKNRHFKNGMTLIARFRLARRSALDILTEDPEETQINHS